MKKGPKTSINLKSSPVKTPTRPSNKTPEQDASYTTIKKLDLSTKEFDKYLVNQIEKVNESQCFLNTSQELVVSQQITPEDHAQQMKSNPSAPIITKGNSPKASEGNFMIMQPPKELLKMLSMKTEQIRELEDLYTQQEKRHQEKMHIVVELNNQLRKQVELYETQMNMRQLQTPTRSSLGSPQNNMKNQHHKQRSISPINNTSMMSKTGKSMLTKTSPNRNKKQSMLTQTEPWENPLQVQLDSALMKIQALEQGKIQLMEMLSAKSSVKLDARIQIDQNNVNNSVNITQNRSFKKSSKLSLENEIDFLAKELRIKLEAPMIEKVRRIGMVIIEQEKQLKQFQKIQNQTSTIRHNRVHSSKASNAWTKHEIINEEESSPTKDKIQYLTTRLRELEELNIKSKYDHQTTQRQLERARQIHKAQLNELLDNHNAQVKRYEEDLKKSQTIAENLVQMNNFLKKENEQLMKSQQQQSVSPRVTHSRQSHNNVKEKEEESGLVKKLKMEIQTLNMELNDQEHYRKKIQNLEQQAQQNHEMKLKLQQDISDLQTQLEEKEYQICGLELQLKKPQPQAQTKAPQILINSVPMPGTSKAQTEDYSSQQRADEAQSLRQLNDQLKQKILNLQDQLEKQEEIMQIKFDKLQNEREQLSSEKKKLQKELEGVTDQNSNLKFKLNEAQNLKEQQPQQAENHDGSLLEKNKQLQIEVNSLQQQVKLLGEKNAELQVLPSEIKRTTDLNNNLKIENDQLKAQLKDLSEQINSLKQRITDLQNGSQAIQQQGFDDLQQEKKTSSEEVKRLLKLQETDQAQINILKAEVERLSTHQDGISELESSEMTGLKAQLEQYLNDNKQLQHKLGLLNSQLEQLKIQNHEAMSQIEELHNNLNAANQQNHMLQKTIDEGFAQINGEEEEDHEDINQKFEEERQEIEKNHAQMTAILNEQIKEMEDTISTLQKENEELKQSKFIPQSVTDKTKQSSAGQDSQMGVLSDSEVEMDSEKERTLVQQLTFEILDQNDIIKTQIQQINELNAFQGYLEAKIEELQQSESVQWMQKYQEMEELYQSLAMQFQQVDNLVDHYATELDKYQDENGQPRVQQSIQMGSEGPTGNDQSDEIRRLNEKIQQQAIYIEAREYDVGTWKQYSEDLQASYQELEKYSETLRQEIEQLKEIQEQQNSIIQEFQNSQS